MYKEFTHKLSRQTMFNCYKMKYYPRWPGVWIVPALEDRAILMRTHVLGGHKGQGRAVEGDGEDVHGVVVQCCCCG